MAAEATDIPQMRIRILELVGCPEKIPSEDDREFIFGLDMLMDMNEVLDAHFAGRVNKVYQDVFGNKE